MPGIDRVKIGSAKSGASCRQVVPVDGWFDGIKLRCVKSKSFEISCLALLYLPQVESAERR